MATAQPSLQRVALLIQYLGTHFYGWQRQPNHRSVQEEIENAIASVVGHKIVIHAAGRTDTGVHAAAQVAHFDVVTLIPAHRWADVINARLPDDVLIRASAAVPLNWHARFSATWRRYRYTIYTEARPNLFARSLSWHYYHAPLDELKIQKALHPMIGRHHMAAFQRANSSRPHAWVDLQVAECVRQDPFLYIEVQASGFLYGMMRLLVGLLVDVGRGDRSVEDFTDLWKNERRDEVRYAAPPQGLCLLRVGYPDMPFPSELWFDTQPKLVLPRSTVSELTPL